MILVLEPTGVAIGVQGTANSFLGNSISAPDLADLEGGGSAAQDQGRPAAPEGGQENPEAMGQLQRPFTASEGRSSLDCCSTALPRTPGEAAVKQPGVCASPGEPPSEPPSAR